MDTNVLGNTKIQIQAIREAQFLEKGAKNLFDPHKAQVVEKRHDLVRVVSCRDFDIKCSFFGTASFQGVLFGDYKIF
jgi:hypothetical protein